MLAQQHLYQRGTALDVWAYGIVYRQWRHDLGAQHEPITQIRVDEARFSELFLKDGVGFLDRPVIAFIGRLPPQQRLTLLLVYGDGFEYEDAARILDVSPDIIAARLVRMSGALADEISARPPAKASAIVQTLYPEGQGDTGQGGAGQGISSHGSDSHASDSHGAPL